MLRSVAIELLLCAVTVQAFFPWFPNYICQPGEPCEGRSKRTLPEIESKSSIERDIDGSTLLSFPLRKKTPVDELPTSERVALAASRARRRHATAARTRTVAPVAPVDHVVDKRANAYKIVTAATPSQTNSAGINQDGTDFSYFVEAKVGSSSKSTYMLIDTGAGTTWIMGSDCKTDACTVHNTWGPADSTTDKPGSNPFSISYGTGSVAGALYSDTISVASLKVSMTFGVANTTSDDFTHFPFDGILGLSMSAGATDNFLGQMKADKLLPASIFGVHLSRTLDGGINDGQITFGGIDSSKYTGAVTYTNVAAEADGDWAIPLDDMAYDGKKAGINGRNAYIDTGTSYVFGPQADIAALHKVIPGAASGDGITYTAPCSSTKPVTVSFGGVSHDISAKDWLSPPSSSGVCTSNIYGHEVVAGAWLMGDLFLKNVYAVFDADKQRIGFAAAVSGSTKPASTATSSTALSPSSSSGTLPSTQSSSSGATPLTTSVSPVPAASRTSSMALSGQETSAVSGSSTMTKSSLATVTASATADATTANAATTTTSTSGGYRVVAGSSLMAILASMMLAIVL